MKTALIGLIALLSLQGASAPVTLTSLAGTWQSTFVPPPRSAPIFPPTLTIAVKGDDATVAFGLEKPTPTRVLSGVGRPREHVSALVVDASPAAPARPRFVLKPIAQDQIRVEWYQDQGKGPGRYHEEIFKKQ